MMSRGADNPALTMDADETSFSTEQPRGDDTHTNGSCSSADNVDVEKGEAHQDEKKVPKSIIGHLNFTPDTRRKIKIGLYIAAAACYGAYFGYYCHIDIDNDPSLAILTGLVILILLLRLWWSRYGAAVSEQVEELTSQESWVRGTFFAGRIIPTLVIIGILTFSIIDSQNNWPRLRAIAGIALIYSIAALLSQYPTRIQWVTVLRGSAVQLALALIILRTNPGYEAFDWLGEQARRFIAYSDTGAEFVFGETYLDHQMAFQAMPVALFFGAVTNVLYYFGVLQVVVQCVGWVIQCVMGTGTIESFVAASNIFFGPTESVITVKRFLPDMTRAELHSVLCVGFGTISGGVMALYIAFGISASHIVTASVMSAPAALAISRVLLPEIEVSRVAKAKDIKFEKPTESNVIEAASNGAQSCVKLVTYIVVNLLVFTSLIDFLDHTFAWFGERVGKDNVTFELVISYIFSPIAYMMGVTWEDCKPVGELVAKALILNSFFSFIDLGILINNRKAGIEPSLHVRSEAIATYAICNFANFGSVGMNLGAMGAIAPDRKKDLSKVAIRALLGGSLASYMTACIAGLLFDEDAALQ